MRGIDLSASTRCNIISVLHSFFGWAEAEDYVDTDPSRRIQRPPKRRPRVKRATANDLTRVRAVAMGRERPPILLMEGVGLRSAEVRGCRWKDIDLERRIVLVQRKGGNWQSVPLDPEVALELRISLHEFEPDPDDYVFTVEVEVWINAHTRERRLKDPKQPRSAQALWRMVKRVCERAGVESLSPHPLRRGYANRFLQESERDMYALRDLMGHARIETTQLYTEDLTLDALHETLDQIAARRATQASPKQATDEDETPDDPEVQKWRRRESNPRPRSHRQGVYERSPRFGFARRPVRERPTDGLAILKSRALGDWLSLCAEPDCWRPDPGLGPCSAGRRYLVLTRRRVRDRSSHLRCAGGFTRPTGDLGSQLCRRTDHVETWTPPYVCSLAR